MESPQHQEWRARQRPSVRAIFFTGIIAGIITFIFSGGTPWTSAGTMNSIMGRVVLTNAVTLLVGHLVLAWLYAGALALATFRFRLVPAIFAGLLAGVGCYVVNAAIFHGLGLGQESPESRAVVTHIVFALFGTAIYKGLAVPRPSPDVARGA